MFRGPAVDEMMQRHKPKRGKHTSFPPTFHGQVIKQWTVKSDADYPGSWYTRTCALKPEIKEAITPSLAKEIEDLLGPTLYETYASNLKLKTDLKGRGKHYTGGALPPPPKLAMAPGKPLELSGTLRMDASTASLSAASATGGSLGGTRTSEVATHQITWTKFGPIPSHSYVEAERLDSFDDWFARFGKPANLVGSQAASKWTRSGRVIGGAKSQVISMKPGNLTR